MKMLPYEQTRCTAKTYSQKSQDKDLDIVISKNVSRSFDNFFPVMERTGTKSVVT